MKEEFPQMDKFERQMIVKDKWKRLQDKEKLIYVLMARVEEEKLHYWKIQEFYDERIKEAKSWAL